MAQLHSDHVAVGGYSKDPHTSAGSFQGDTTGWTESDMPAITSPSGFHSSMVDNTDPTLDDWAGNSIYHIAGDDDVEFEEWLKTWGAFQNIFPSA